jgi:gliding motility-associated-like protein
VPVIDFISPLCNTSPTVALTANPPGGVWSGNSGVSPSGIQNPVFNSIGSNSVVYTSGQGTCVASSTATFHVSQFNTAAITGTIPNLCVSSNPVSLKAIVQNTLTGVWSGLGVNATPSGYYFSPANLPTGIDTLTYHTTSWPIAGLCDHSAHIVVSVLNPPTPVITQVGPYCSKDATVQLAVSPATGTWTALSYINTSGIFTPSLAAIGNNLVQYVIGTPTCNMKSTKFISVEAFVMADISLRLPPLCNSSAPANLIPLSVSGAGAWSGTGVQGTNFNPGISGAGLFMLNYHTASSPSGLCPDQDTLSVRVYSLAPPSVSQAGPFCDKSLAVQLQVSPVGGIFGGANTGAVTPSGLFNPAFGIIGDNVISYSIASGPCIAYAQSTISIEKFISADFSDNVALSYCRNTLPFNMNSLVQNPGGYWSGAAVSSNGIFDPSRANPGSNNPVTYITTSTLCPDSKTVKLTIDEIPAVSIAGAIDGCAPLSVNLNIPETNQGQQQWNFGDGTQLEGPNGQHVYHMPGTYNVVLNYTLGACHTTATLNNPINVSESPRADFSFSKQEVSIAEPEVTLLNESTPIGKNRYRWSIEGMADRFELMPVITFTKTGTYRVTLTATSFGNCKDDITKLIEVKNDFNVFIPNSFTPNEDGLNDVFRPVFSPYGLDEKTYEMTIYDRWGHVLFHTKDINKGWDGTIQNAGQTPLKQDTYVYTLKFKDTEGKGYYRTGYIALSH